VDRPDLSLPQRQPETPIDEDTVANGPIAALPAADASQETLLGARPLPALSTRSPTGSAEELPTIGHIGRYALKYRIGEGGLGTVYAAHDPLLSRLIAIKTVNVDIAPESRKTFDALFLNEARAAGGLSHPHIVTVFDAGISEQGVYIAMELLKGRDLRQLRQDGWRPTPAQAAMITRRVADALGYAHAKGVVHRDIKPANIFMVGRTQPRVLDFGIARIAHQHDMLGDDSITAGSPYYMAPEQLRHEPVDRRGDVFSLGVVFYELLTGHKPFGGKTVAEISESVLEQTPPLAHEVDPAIPAALAAIAARAMEKNPEYRYRSARGMSRELRHWLEEQAQSAEESGEPAARRRGRPVWAALAGSAALLAGVAWWLAPTSGAPQSAAGPTSEPTVATPPATAAPLAADTAGIMATATAPTLGQRGGVPPPTVVAGEADAKPLPARTPASRDSTRRATKANETRSAATPTADATPLPATTGLVHLAVSPWGQIEVDGRGVGTTPPVNQLTLSEGVHTITVRNNDFPPYTLKVNVSGAQPVTIRHRF
jgi:hypothetical protein